MEVDSYHYPVQEWATSSETEHPTVSEERVRYSPYTETMLGQLRLVLFRNLSVLGCTFQPCSKSWCHKNLPLFCSSYSDLNEISNVTMSDRVNLELSLLCRFGWMATKNCFTDLSLTPETLTSGTSPLELTSARG